jgi:hypothetical protein
MGEVSHPGSTAQAGAVTGTFPAGLPALAQNGGLLRHAEPMPWGQPLHPAATLAGLHRHWQFPPPPPTAAPHVRSIKAQYHSGWAGVRGAVVIGKEGRDRGPLRVPFLLQATHQPDRSPTVRLPTLLRTSSAPLLAASPNERGHFKRGKRGTQPGNERALPLRTGLLSFYPYRISRETRGACAPAFLSPSPGATSAFLRDVPRHPPPRAEKSDPQQKKRREERISGSKKKSVARFRKSWHATDRN